MGSWLALEEKEGENEQKEEDVQEKKGIQKRGKESWKLDLNLYSW